MKPKFEKFSEDELLIFANENGIKTHGYDKEVVSGISYVRKLSSEIKWIDGSIENLSKPNSAKNYSILSKLGNPWQTNWNLNAEEIPFTLIITELQYFLELCISKFNFSPAYIEWTWDRNNFYLLKIKLFPEYNFKRLLIPTNSFKLTETEIDKSNIALLNSKANEVLNEIDENISIFNEPLYINYNNNYFINFDLFYSIIFFLGIKCKSLTLLNNKFPVIKFKLTSFLLKTNLRNSFNKKLNTCIKTERDNFKLNFLNLIKFIVSNGENNQRYDLKKIEVILSDSEISK
ncbi:MAG TPA: hypothetical protein PLG90_08095 [Ignavibacteria bacterium]|nr:hypothetical protein [Ignavibacteria bacterium]